MSEARLSVFRPDRLQVLKAISLLLLAIIFFDLMSVLVRTMIVRGYTPLELSAYRNVLGIFPSLMLLVFTGEIRLRGSNLYIEKWRLALFRGLVVALAQLFFYTAIGFLELATVSALGQTNSLFVVALSVVVLGESVGRWRWAAVAIGFTGAMLILKPGSDAFSLAALLPIGAALCYGYSMVTVRKFGPNVSNALLYLYSSVASAVGAILMATMTTNFSPLASWMDALIIFAMALLGGRAFCS